MNNESLLAKMIGGKISNISRICDLISIQIDLKNGEKVYLHIQTFLRMIKENKVIISSEDIYRCDKKYNIEDFNWDIPGQSIFDVSVKEIFPLLSVSKIVSFYKNSVGDFNLNFENGISLQILIDTIELGEKYRIFDDTDSICFIHG